GDPDAPHSWTYVPDVAEALVTAAFDERSWGRAWHVPTAPPVTYRKIAELTCELAGAPAPKVGSIPQWLVNAARLFSPLLAEIKYVRYQFDRPFVVDSSAFTETFGLTPTPVAEGLAATVDWWRAGAPDTV